MLDKLEAGDFKKYLNDKFKIHREGADEMEAKLVEVHELGTPGHESVADHHRTAFAIIFKAHGNYKDMEQSIHTVEHAKLGKLELLLVPVVGADHDDDSDYYEAIFT